VRILHQARTEAARRPAQAPVVPAPLQPRSHSVPAKPSL
jgi:hypothetical protein